MFCRCSHALEGQDAAPLREAEGELIAASRDECKWRVGRRAGDETHLPTQDEAEDGADAAQYDHAIAAPQPARREPELAWGAGSADTKVRQKLRDSILKG